MLNCSLIYLKILSLKCCNSDKFDWYFVRSKLIELVGLLTKFPISLLKLSVVN